MLDEVLFDSNSRFRMHNIRAQPFYSADCPKDYKQYEIEFFYPKKDCFFDFHVTPSWREYYEDNKLNPIPLPVEVQLTCSSYLEYKAMLKSLD